MNQHSSQAEEVGSEVDLSVRHLLGREIVGAAENPLFLHRARWVEAPLAESEVGELGLAPQREQDVRLLRNGVQPPNC